jgi:lambda family phage minor tail protein L
MTIRAEIQSLSPSALLDFFILDTTNLPGGSVMRFHAGTNGLSQPVVWQGQTYEPLPIEASGFDVTAKGALPRPKLKVANAGGFLSASVKTFNDFVGCKITRKRTFAKYLDAINFPGGTNATADPNQFIPDDLWYVERKVTENRYIIEFELSSAFDLMGQQLPSRQIIQNSCSWKYRSGECGWTGGNFDKNNNPTNAVGDACAKTLAACKVRFGTQPIRFGGFPGAVRGAD